MTLKDYVAEYPYYIQYQTGMGVWLPICGQFKTKEEAQKELDCKVNRNFFCNELRFRVKKDK